jgi:hypothetical protein
MLIGRQGNNHPSLLTCSGGLTRVLKRREPTVLYRSVEHGLIGLIETCKLACIDPHLYLADVMCRFVNDHCPSSDNLGLLAAR